ncbi:hypothetical protein VNI00_017249 [Paramarasmius palmivorus]|uniref:Uncharacterized protein n=1 Tax=Paramarasmius palmivorus TaxID=297713 RepID=A0AAW0B9N5_9AGAR
MQLALAAFEGERVMGLENLWRLSDVAKDMRIRLTKFDSVKSGVVRAYFAEQAKDKLTLEQWWTVLSFATDMPSSPLKWEDVPKKLANTIVGRVELDDQVIKAMADGRIKIRLTLSVTRTATDTLYNNLTRTPALMCRISLTAKENLVQLCLAVDHARFIDTSFDLSKLHFQYSICRHQDGQPIETLLYCLPQADARTTFTYGSSKDSEYHVDDDDIVKFNYDVVGPIGYRGVHLDHESSRSL